MRRLALNTISRSLGLDSAANLYSTRNVPAKSNIFMEFHKNLTLVRHSTTLSQAAAGTAVSKDEKREFMAVFPDIVRDLTDAGRHLDIPEATKWYAKVLQYNVPGGKKNRGLALVLGYKHLAKSSDLTPENIRLAHILGWCVELLQGAFLVWDDCIDESSTRRGRPCWYKIPGVGLKAINDGNLLESGVYQLLRRHFKSRPYYVDIVELFHDVSLKTKMGQTLDLLGAQQNHTVDLDNLSMDRYNSIVKYKTAYYSFHLPIALAMRMAGINDEERHRQAKTILLEMGHFFQVQDDYMDCFGNPEVTGKVGTDIQEGKCSWLVVVALQRATSEQRQLLKLSKPPETAQETIYDYESWNNEASLSINQLLQRLYIEDATFKF